MNSWKQIRARNFKLYKKQWVYFGISTGLFLLMSAVVLIGIAVDAIDCLNGASNQCGLYGSILIVNGDTIFEQRTDRVPFESTQYENSHKDFEEY